VRADGPTPGPEFAPELSGNTGTAATPSAADVRRAAPRPTTDRQAQRTPTPAS